ncbi:hypothetical protein ABG067_006125 [Albugo candida]
MVRSLPLRSGFFATPHLDPSEEAELLQWTRSMVPELHQFDADWTLLHEKKGVQVSEDRQKGGLSYGIKSVASVRATLAEMMNMFTTTSTAEFRSLFHFLLNDFFLDGAQLYHQEHGETEYVGIKWLAMGHKSVINPMLHNQDLCLVEYSGILSADIIGKDKHQSIGVCLLESIEQSECPSLWSSHRLQRGSVTKCGFLFIPKSEGFIEARFTCCIRQPPNQRSQRRLNRQFLLQWAESIGFLEESLSRKRISRDLTVRKTPTWVDDKDRHCCRLCLKAFSNTRRKHHCRACGEIICRHCSIYQSVDLQSVGLTTLRVCKACMDGSRSSQLVGQTSVKNDVTDKKLRDAVEEYALALPIQSIPNVPDLVGVAWLRQIAARDPSKQAMVSNLLEQLRIGDLGNDLYEDVRKDTEVDIYDTLCDLAAQTLACTYAAVNLIDENRQWFKSAIHVREADVPRDFSFCEYPVRDQRPLIVMDTLEDPRFRQHPFVTGPLAVRFLAAAPLFTVENECVGAVCVLDTEPRDTLQESQIATMQNLAHLAMVMVQERREAQQKGSRMTKSQLMSSYRPKPKKESDLVLLSGYDREDELVVASRISTTQQEDPVLKEQMIQLLHKASQVRDQVTQQSRSAVQHAGLQSSGE